MSHAIIFLQEGVRAKMHYFDNLFKEFEEKHPKYLQNHITIDHFCWDCKEIGDHDIILSSLWKTKSIDQSYTSLISKNEDERKISIARLCDYSFNCGFLEQNTLSKNKYFEISDQDLNHSQQEGIAHVEIFWRQEKNFFFLFENGMLFNFFGEKGHIWKPITRGKYEHDIWEITDPDGFKLRFCQEFLVNTIGKKELSFFL